MPECVTINCCLPDDFEYQVSPSEGVYLRTLVDPADGGTTSGDGTYAVGDDATASEVPAIPTSIDVGVDFVFVVDESASMASAHDILANVTSHLETTLMAAGIGSTTVANRYACVAFGFGDPAVTEIDFTDGATFAAAAPGIGLSKTGPPPTLEEDAYEGIDYAINQLAWRDPGSVTRIIFFITNEDRNEHRYANGADQAEQYDNLKAELVAGGFVLAGLFNCSSGSAGLHDGFGNVILATDYLGNCYYADGSGGVVASTGGQGTFGPFSDGDTPAFPTGQEEEYFDLLMDPETKGYVFNLIQYNIDANHASSVKAAIVPMMAERITQELVWTFVGWYNEGGELVSLESDYTFPIQENTILTARFEHS